MSAGFVGTSVKRLEDEALLTGQGRYIDDLEMPGLLEAAFVRSPHPHARIVSIDTAAARELPGVRAVFTQADLAAVLTSNIIPSDHRTWDFPETSQPLVMVADEACYVGEPVAVVIADSRYTAEDAAALVDVGYEPLASVSDCRDALAPGAPTAHRAARDNVVKEIRTEYGDCDAAFATATHVYSVSLKQHRGGAHSIEPRGILVRPEAGSDQVTVWISTQAPHRIRNQLVELLGADEHRVRVIVPDVGGGFGGKNILYADEASTVAAALLLGEPVKWIEDRREHFLAAIQERDQYWDMEVATDAEGRLLGIRGRVVHDQGAQTLLALHVPHNSSIAVPGPYVLPNYRIDVIVVETNKVGTIPVRGAGYPEGAFAMERLLDAAAAGLGLDRAEIRRRNLVPGERIPYELPMKTREGTPIVYESGDFPAVQRQAMETAEYAGFAARRAEARAEGRFLGLGIANMTKVTGRGPFETALVRIGRSGQVTVYTGAIAMGQGTKTTLAQICAGHLGIDPGDITVVAGDTAGVPNGIGGFGSRQTVTAGGSTHAAALEVRAKAIRAAAHQLEAAEEDLELAGGSVRVRGVPELSVTLKDLARALSGMKGYRRPKDMPSSLEATVDFLPHDVTYGFATHVVEVEVDPGTGGVRILRYVIANDSGRIVNPMLADGQLQGGTAHGIGNALFEWMGYDEHGQPVVTTLADYLLPTATEVPNFEIVHCEYPSTLNPMGVKGIGEAGTIPAAAAVISAVEDALGPFGIRIGEAPIAPARLVELMEAAGAAG